METNLEPAKILIQKSLETQNPILDLGNCGISSLESLPELFECIHLESLSLSNSWWDFMGRIDTTSQNIGSRNKINSIPATIGNLKYLKYLSITDNYGISGTIDLKNLEKLEKLEYLDLSYYSINNFESLENLASLEYLSIYKSNINKVDLTYDFPSLKYFKIGANTITDLNFLVKLPNLVGLNISSNPNGDISFLWNIPTLQLLNLSHNQLTNINFLSNFTELYYLDISVNNIFDINYLSQCVKLQSLFAGMNNISAINFTSTLEELHTIDLSSNLISDLKFLSHLKGLTNLNLSSNKITNIDDVSNLPFLEDLVLNTNKIKKINSLAQIKRLKNLSLSSNQISDIRILSELTNLKSLNLSINRISNIDSLSSLSNLRTLDVKSNLIKEISSSIFNLEIEANLEQIGINGLSLYDNPIESPPIEIIKQGQKSILDWFHATKKKLNEIKVILLGDPKAGKTSLLKRLRYDDFDPNEVQTDGINIENIEFGFCKAFEKFKSLHNLTGHFWDFGGQEIMNATHQFFLTNRSVYILVLDARKDTNISAQIRHWVKRIKSTGGNSPIIVVANQLDVNPGFGFANEYELRNEFPQLKHFIKVSCQTGENIDLIREMLEELIPQAEFFNTDVDERWIHIKEKLQKETKTVPFLNENKFENICLEFGLNEKDGRNNAINFLNDLGLVLHFEELNLSEYYVLEPYWITYGVYQILTSAYAGKEKGVVSMDMLDFIVNEEEDKKEIYRPATYIKIKYSPNESRFLVDILNQFKLCYYLPDHKKFIIPDLLDTTEPLNITKPIREDQESIEFVFQYEYLPSSTLPQIMVETNQLILEKWRTGIVLQYNNCNALLTNYQNRISITVVGEHKKKREFMAIIRHIIDLINTDLIDKPKMLIPLKEVNSFADYAVLLNREKKGRKEFIFDEDKPSEKSFEISLLLEGIPTQDEVREISKKIDILLINTDGMKTDLIDIKSTQEEIKSKLDKHYEYLINLPQNIKIKEEVLDALKEIDVNQYQKISDDIMELVTKAFTNFDGQMDSKLKKIYEDLKKTKDLEMKLKLSIPLINLLGIDVGIESKFDIRSWTQKMFKKHKLKIFKLMMTHI